MAAKNEQAQKEFLADYENRYGEKVFSYILGKYLSGWPDYKYPLWGLLIATDGGFHFHHFPQEGWMQVQIRVISGSKPSIEKTIFIPREDILSVELHLEKSWWKKILVFHPPILAVRYRHRDPQNAERASAGLLLAEAHQTANILVSELIGDAGKGPLDSFAGSG